MDISLHTFIICASVYCAIGVLVNIGIVMMSRRKSSSHRTVPLRKKIAWAVCCSPLFPIYVYLYINECRDWHYDS